MQAGRQSKQRKQRPRRRKAKSVMRPVSIGTRVVGCPDKMTVSLKYPILKLINSVASSGQSVRFYTNGVYDVDPTLGSTSTPYFSEWTAMYSYYRVLSYKLDVHVTNNETSTVNFYVVHSNTDPGTTGINYLQYANASYNKVTSLAANTAQHSMHVVSRLSPMRIVGDRAVRTEQNFWGSSTSNPVDSTYIGLGASINSGNLTNGVYVTGFLEFFVEFFDRKNLQVSFYKQPVSPDDSLNANFRIEKAQKESKLPDPKDLEIREKVIQWRKSIEAEPYEQEIRRRLQPYVRV